MIRRLPVCGVGSELEGVGGTVPVRQLATKVSSKNKIIFEQAMCGFHFLL